MSLDSRIYSVLFLPRILVLFRFSRTTIRHIFGLRGSGRAVKRRRVRDGVEILFKRTFLDDALLLRKMIILAGCEITVRIRCDFAYISLKKSNH